MVTARRQALDGKPSIPAATNLPAMQAAVNQIRTRLDKLDAAVNQAYTTLDASSPAESLESLQGQITSLSKQLDILAEQLKQALKAADKPATVFAMQMGDDGEDGLVGPPGPPGPQGERGHTMVPDEHDSEFQVVIGPAGPPGPPGERGYTIAMDQYDYEEHFVMGPPGERGPAGATGGMVVLDFCDCSDDGFPVGFPATPAAAGGSSSLTATYVGFGSGSNALTGSSNFTWDDTNRKIILGVGTGPSRIFSANAVSGAGASSLTIQTGDANPGVVGAGLLSLQGGAGGGASAAGNIEINGGSTTGSSTGGSIAISGGTSSSGTAGTITLATGGVTRVTIAAGGGVTIASALTLSSTLAGTSASFSSTLSATSGTFSSTLQATSLLVTGTTAPSNGVYLQATGVVGLSANSTAAYKYGSNAFLSQDNNTRDLGESGIAWRNIYSNNLLNVVSDIRQKTDIESSDLGLEFINALRPVSYRMRIGGYSIDSGVKKDLPGKRRHYGLLSQQVREAFTSCGVDDFAGWCLNDPSDPNSGQTLRYGAFIGPIIKAIQELYEKVNQYGPPGPQSAQAERKI